MLIIGQLTLVQLLFIFYYSIAKEREYHGAYAYESINKESTQVAGSIRKLLQDLDEIQLRSLAPQKEVDCDLIDCVDINPEVEEELLLEEEEFCQDIPPDGVDGFDGLNCTYYAESDLCDYLNRQYCHRSCNFCGCSDIPLPNLNCSTILKEGLCNDPLVIRNGIFINSCGKGNCTANVTPSQPTPPPVTNKVSLPIKPGWIFLVKLLISIFKSTVVELEEDEFDCFATINTLFGISVISEFVGFLLIQSQLQDLIYTLFATNQIFEFIFFAFWFNYVSEINKGNYFVWLLAIITGMGRFLLYVMYIGLCLTGILPFIWMNAVSVVFLVGIFYGYSKFNLHTSPRFILYVYLLFAVPCYLFDISSLAGWTRYKEGSVLSYVQLIEKVIIGSSTEEWFSDAQLALGQVLNMI